MNNLINISLNSLRMEVYIECRNVEISQRVYSILSAHSQVIHIHRKNIIVPWEDFKSAINNLRFFLSNEKVEVSFDEKMTNLIRQHIDNIKSFENGEPFLDLGLEDIKRILYQEKFNRILKSFQLRDVKLLLDKKHGANFSVPGAGKTTSLLAVFTILNHLKIVNNLFIVAPLNAFISWEDEIKEILPYRFDEIHRLDSDEIKSHEFFFSTKKDILLVNYEKLRKDILNIFQLFQTRNIHLVLDESHKVKSGFDNLSFNQIVRLSDLSVRKDILSGTPMPQSPNDLRSQFYFLWGYDVFARIPNNTNAINSAKQFNKIISGKYVRTTKNELGLRNPNIVYTEIKLGPVQEEIYLLLKSEIARRIRGLDKESKDFFRRMGRSSIRLLQSTINPMMLAGIDEDDDDLLVLANNEELLHLLIEFKKFDKPAKIEYLKQKINNHLVLNNTRKIIIWTNFVSNIILLERIFADYNPVTIYGKIPTGNETEENTREWNIRKFHEDKTCNLMIANPQAGGEGISLHKVCHDAIYLDRNFNAAYYLQSVDRIHRLGLDPKIDTTIEILIAKNTIDEIIISRLNKKISAMGTVLNDNQLRTLSFDPESISELDEYGIDRIDVKEIACHVLEN